MRKMYNNAENIDEYMNELNEVEINKYSKDYFAEKFYNCSLSLFDILFPTNIKQLSINFIIVKACIFIYRENRKQSLYGFW